MKIKQPMLENDAMDMQAVPGVATTPETQEDGTIINSAENSLKFKVVESYKVLRANIMFSIIKSGCRSFVVSSSLPSEGKSTIAVNTAIALSQTDARVLLIDTDLRRPKINRFLGLPNTPGLSNYLIGMNSINEVLHKTTYPNLMVFCAGSRVPNPSELLASAQMETLLEQLKTKFDYIVIDSAPLNVVSDTYPIIKNTDGVLMVVYQNRSDYKELDKTMKSLEMVDCKVIGFVLNGVTNSNRKGYYSNSYGYGYGYGSGYGYGTYGYSYKSKKKSRDKSDQNE